MEEYSAQQFMIKNVITFSEDENIYSAMNTLVKKKISGAPVLDKSGKLVGVLSEKDCLTVLIHNSFHQLPEGKVSEYMSTDLKTISPNTSIFEVADLFTKHSIRRLPVVDKNRLVGQISRRDVVIAITKMRK